MTLAEMVEVFRLEDVSSSPGFFDMKKLRAFNGDAIRELSDVDFVTVVQPFLPPERDMAVFRRVARDVQERVAVLSEAWPLVRFLYEEPTIERTAFKAGADEVLAGAIGVFETVEWTASEIEAAIMGWGDAQGMKVQAPIRLAVTGDTKGLPLWNALEVLGRERTLARLRAARA
jgi:glutamyl-tRNA synthetase